MPAAILAVCRFHRNTNGWNDIGYNFVVDRFGRIWEARDGGIDEAVMGSHAQGYNAQTTGIANLGTFTSVPQSGRGDRRDGAPDRVEARQPRRADGRHDEDDLGRRLIGALPDTATRAASRRCSATATPA